MKKKRMPRVKYCLEKCIERYEGPYAVLLSGGADSHANLFTMLDMGLDVHAYSATLETKESRDFRAARATCEEFGVPFNGIYLPTDIDDLEADIRENVHLIGCKSKVETEALWVFRKIIDQSAQPTLVSGLAAGIFFCLTKKGMIHYKHNRIDEYRTTMFEGKSDQNSQSYKIKRYARSVGKTWVNPWITNGMLKTFLGTTWEDVNKPRQKEAIRREWEDYFARTKVYNQLDMHKGDSGISELFAQLLDIEHLNPSNKFKSVVGIYNKIYAEETKEQPVGLL